MTKTCDLNINVDDSPFRKCVSSFDRENYYRLNKLWCEDYLPQVYK